MSERAFRGSVVSVIGVFIVASIFSIGCGRSRTVAYPAEQSLLLSTEALLIEYVRGAETALRMAAQGSEMRSGSPAKQKAALEGMLKIHPQFVEMTAYASGGRETAHSQKFEKRHASPEAVPGSVAGADALERFEGIYPVMWITVPLRPQEGGSKSGQMSALLSLNGISGALRRILGPNESLTVMIVNEQGELAAHPDAEKVYRKDARLSEAERRAVGGCLTRQADGASARIEVIEGDDGRWFCKKVGGLDLKWYVLVRSGDR